MKGGLVTHLAAGAAGIVVVALLAGAATGETSQRPPLIGPHIAYVRVRATLLHWGMSPADIARVMGAPAQIDAANDDEGTVRVLKYWAEPIATTVAITNGKLSGVALDIAGVDDPALPNFTRAAWLGMSRTAVLQRLGAPTESQLRSCDGMKVEQMMFERPGEPDVSIFLIGGRLAAKKVGRSFPGDILGFTLPLAPDPADDESDKIAEGSRLRLVAVGMKESELRAQFGTPKLQVPYTFKGHAAEHAIYETNPGKSFGSFTFIDGALIDFADGGRTSLHQVLEGR
jgi:hypothetical protein